MGVMAATPFCYSGMTSHQENTDGVYWIRAPEQYDCLMSARRMEIVDQLANVGPTSVRSLAAMIGVKPSSLYHHIKQLEDVGLIEQAGVRTVNRRIEKLYKTPGAAMRYGLSLEDPKAYEIFKKLGEVQSRQTARDFARGLQSGQVIGSGPQKNAWIYRLVGAPDAVTMAKINEHLEAIAELFWQSTGADNPLIVMSAIVAPVPRQNKTEAVDDV